MESDSGAAVLLASRRSAQAPARGPAAVCPHRRPIRTETQQTRPLLVGRVCVNFEPKALAAGTAGPPFEEQRPFPRAPRPQKTP